MKLMRSALRASLWTATVVHAFTPSGHAEQQQSALVLKANGLKMDQFSNFYEGIGYKPKTDVGHDGQQFVPIYGERSAEDVAKQELAGTAPPPTEAIDARPEDMMSGVFDGFHSSVGYTPLPDDSADAPTFTPAADLYETIEVSKTTSIPVGEIAANGLPKEAYSQFYADLGYNPVPDVGADAQEFAPTTKDD